MQINPSPYLQSEYPTQAKIYLLWDESYFWGVMLWRALRYLQIPFATCTSREIARGLLQVNPPRALIVPGGFASAKANSLGSSGRSKILEFTRDGGKYLGFCGGAGLALDNSPQPGLGLCSWKRKPASQRLPNCSGHIKVQPTSAADFPENLDIPVSVPIWWPSQFCMEKSENISTLATYKVPDTDFWVGDLPLSLTDKQSLRDWERLYHINLDPELLRNEPCMISGAYGQGGFLLSYLHLETPGSAAANTWLSHILSQLGAGSSNPHPAGEALIDSCTVPEWDLGNIPENWDDPDLRQAIDIVHELVRIGEENFLFCWRKPWLLGWRRGIPGFALNSLLAMLSLASELKPGEEAIQYWQDGKGSFLEQLQKYKSLYQNYLIQKRLHLARDIETSSREPGTELENLKKQLTVSSREEDVLINNLFKFLQELLWLQIRNTD